MIEYLYSVLFVLLQTNVVNSVSPNIEMDLAAAPAGPPVTLAPPPIVSQSLSPVVTSGISTAGSPSPTPIHPTLAGMAPPVPQVPNQQPAQPPVSAQEQMALMHQYMFQQQQQQIFQHQWFR